MKPTQEEIIGAFILHYTNQGASPDFIRGIKAGVKLMVPNAQDHIAPAWLRDYRENKEQKP